MKNITIAQGVGLAPQISGSLAALDPFFEGFAVQVTSGLRRPEDQLRIIIDKVKKHGINKVFLEFDENLGKPIDTIVQIGDLKIYWWQRSFSKCLEIQDIVNPPIACEVLGIYFRPPHPSTKCDDPECMVKHNRKGRILDISPHQKGIAFDLSGNNLDGIGSRIETAMKTGNCHITDYLIEKVNNAVHVGIAFV